MNDSNNELYAKAFVFSLSLFVGLFLVQLAVLFLMQYLDPGAINSLNQNMGIIHLVFISWFNFVYCIILYFLFAFVLEKRTMYKQRFSFKYHALFHLFIAVVVVAIIILIYIGVLKINGAVNIIAQKPEKVYLVLMFALFSAVSEEIVFRGYLLEIFRSSKKDGLGIIVSSTVFALLHIFNPMMNVLTFINVFVIGVLLALITVRIQSIYFAIGFHFSFNFLDIFLDLNHVISENNHRIWKLDLLLGNELLTGGHNGITGSLILTIALLIFVVLIFINSKKAGKAEYKGS